MTGTIEGFIEIVTEHRVAGWVYAPDGAALDVLVLWRGQSIAHGRADVFREDLVEVGKGGGEHGFDFDFEHPYPPGEIGVWAIARDLCYRIDPLPAEPGIEAPLEGSTYGPIRTHGPADLIGRAIARYGEWARLETLFLAQFIGPTSVVWDIGAYIGTFSLSVALLGARRIVAVEPMPGSAALLRENLARSPNVIVVEAVCAPTEQSLARVIHNDPINQGATAFGFDEGAGSQASFATCTLRQLRRDQSPPDLIKLDIEGGEGEVIASDAEWLARAKPILWVECNESAASLDVFRLLDRLGYAVYLYAFPAFNRFNGKGDADDLFGGRYEAALLAVRPRQPVVLPAHLQEAGAMLTRIETEEKLRQALWQVPRHDVSAWSALDRPALLALLGRAAAGQTYERFLVEEGATSGAPTGER